MIDMALCQVREIQDNLTVREVFEIPQRTDGNLVFFKAKALKLSSYVLLTTYRLNSTFLYLFASTQKSD